MLRLRRCERLVDDLQGLAEPIFHMVDGDLAECAETVLGEDINGSNAVSITRRRTHFGRMTALRALDNQPARLVSDLLEDPYTSGQGATELLA